MMTEPILVNQAFSSLPIKQLNIITNVVERENLDNQTKQKAIGLVSNNEPKIIVVKSEPTVRQVLIN